MTLEALTINSSKDAEALLALSQKMTHLTAFQRMFSVEHFLRVQIIKRNTDRQQDFQIEGPSKVFLGFMEAWSWFGNFGMEPDEYEDVIAKSRTVMTSILSGKVTQLSDSEVEEFMKYARSRFEEIKKTDKYKNTGREPIGH